MVQMLENMPEDHSIEMLLGEMALLQRLGIYLKSFRLGCSRGCQHGALYAVALVSQLRKLMKQQASAAADLKNSASPTHQGVNACGPLPGDPCDKSFHSRNEFDVVGTVVSLGVLGFQCGSIELWKGFSGPATCTSAKGAILLVQSSGTKLVSTASNSDSDRHRAQLNCLYLMNPHLNSKYLMIVRRIDSP